MKDKDLERYYEMAYRLGDTRAHELHGANSIYSMFGKGREIAANIFEPYLRPNLIKKGMNPEEHRFDVASPSTPIPWKQAPRTKSNPRGYNASLVHEVLRQPMSSKNVYEGFDPRKLHGSQPSLIHPAITHYLEQDPKDAELYADKDQVGNRLPFVYIHKNTGLMRLIAGHHRAGAALLKGVPLTAQYVEGE